MTPCHLFFLFSPAFSSSFFSFQQRNPVGAPFSPLLLLSFLASGGQRRRRRRRRRRRGCLGINFDLLLGSAGLDILVYSRVSTNRFYCVPVFNQLVELGKSMFFVHKILCNTPWMHSKTRLSKIKYSEFLGFIANGKTTSVVESFGRSRDEERGGGGGGRRLRQWEEEERNPVEKKKTEAKPYWKSSVS